MAARRRALPTSATPVSPDAFGQPDVSPELLHRVVTVHDQNARQGTQSTKTRGEVNRSGRKIYRQKGTGNARQGDLGAIHHRGGGVAFGPKPRTIDRRLSRRERQAALRGVLAHKAQAGQLLETTGWGESSKTKDRAAWLAEAGAQGRILLIDIEPSDALQRSSRNIPGVLVARADTVSAYDLVVADRVIATGPAIAALQTRGSDGPR